MLAHRVWVKNTSDTRFLFHTTAQNALRLLELGAFEERLDDGDIWCVFLVRTPGVDAKPNPAFGLFSYSGGQQQVFKERLGPKDAFDGHWCYSLKRGTKAETRTIPLLALSGLGPGAGNAARAVKTPANGIQQTAIAVK